MRKFEFHLVDGSVIEVLGTEVTADSNEFQVLSARSLSAAFNRHYVTFWREVKSAVESTPEAV